MTPVSRDSGGHLVPLESAVTLDPLVPQEFLEHLELTDHLVSPALPVRMVRLGQWASVVSRVLLDSLASPVKLVLAGTLVLVDVMELPVLVVTSVTAVLRASPVKRVRLVPMA